MQSGDEGKTRPVIVLAGPTASGKSALALAAAKEFGGTIVNADAMQVYREVPTLTARPSPAEEAEAPHRLYGILPAADPCSAQRWRDLAVAAIAEVRGLPILVGGTGLYLRALMEGLSDMPEVPAEIRARAIARHAELGPQGFHAEVAGRDPDLAARRPAGDTQRLIRAWEVFEASGVPFSHWAAAPRQGPPEGLRFHVAVLDPDRADLYRRIDRRFELMVKAGALDELEAIEGLDPALPLMKALGVPELLAARRGELPLDRAVAAAQQSSRHYAKRQQTWLRHQIFGAFPLFAQQNYQIEQEFFSFIRKSVDRSISAG